jgi:hypothetical protein
MTATEQTTETTIHLRSGRTLVYPPATAAQARDIVLRAAGTYVGINADDAFVFFPLADIAFMSAPPLPAGDGRVTP